MTEEVLAEIEPILRDRLRFANPGASDEEVGDMTRRNMARLEAELGNPIEHFKSPFADAEGRVWLPTSMPGKPFPPIGGFTTTPPPPRFSRPGGGKHTPRGGHFYFALPPDISIPV